METNQETVVPATNEPSIDELKKANESLSEMLTGLQNISVVYLSDGRIMKVTGTMGNDLPGLRGTRIALQNLMRHIEDQITTIIDGKITS